jgi:ABC-type transport system substrate-binding protein
VSLALLSRGRKIGSSSFPWLVLLVLLSGWEAPAAAQGRETHTDAETVYRRPLGNDPATLDPARTSDIYSGSVAEQIFDGLVRFDQTLSVVPALAQFWTASRDGLVWTFKLRQGVRFHHGRAVTAEDVVYSLTRLLDPRVRSGAADLLGHVRGAREFREGRATTVAGIAALDASTVQITLEEAQASLVHILAVGHAKIVPKEIAEQKGENFGLHPVGTGPFRFVHWQRGQEIVLVANREHFEGLPRLTRVVYRIFPGEPFDLMYEEFRKGALEDTPIPTGLDYQRVIAEPGQIHVKRPMLSVRFYGMNTGLKPLDDRRVRQALVHAIDRETMVREVTLGRFAPARGVLPPGTLGFNPKLAGYPFNPDRSRYLLAQAGYPDGRGLPILSIWSSVKSQGVLREHESMRRYLEAVGVRTEFEYLTDWPAFSRMLAQGKPSVFLYAWFADVPDPDNFLFKLFYSKSPRNYFGYASPVVDGLLTTARNTGELERRVELYRRAEQAVMDDAPLIPILHYTYERLFQPYVRSVEVSGLGDPYIPLRKIWLDRR